MVKSIFNEQAIYALMLGGVTWFLAAALMPFVTDRSARKDGEIDINEKPEAPNGCFRVCGSLPVCRSGFQNS
ncbi:MAG: hypothetical protein U5L09_00150 [Bacteroidales bacterium]|nr:hypothetical protein [Bacteroidales bacterium]